MVWPFGSASTPTIFTYFILANVYKQGGPAVFADITEFPTPVVVFAPAFEEVYFFPSAHLSRYRCC